MFLIIYFDGEIQAQHHVDRPVFDNFIDGVEEIAEILDISNPESPKMFDPDRHTWVPIVPQSNSVVTGNNNNTANH